MLGEVVAFLCSRDGVNCLRKTNAMSGAASGLGKYSISSGPETSSSREVAEFGMDQSQYRTEGFYYLKGWVEKLFFWVADSIPITASRRSRAAVDRPLR